MSAVHKIRQFYDLIVIYFEPITFSQGSGLTTSLTPCRRNMRRLKRRVSIIFFFLSSTLPFSYIHHFDTLMSFWNARNIVLFTRNKQLLLTITINDKMFHPMTTYLFSETYEKRNIEIIFTKKVKKINKYLT